MKQSLFGTVLIFMACMACHKDIATSPLFSSFSPDKGSAYNYVTLTGQFTDSIIAHYAISFNSLPGTIFQVNDSSIIVRVPVGATTGKITLRLNGQTTISSSDFTILPGKWLEKSPIPQISGIITGNRAGGIGFSYDGKGYIGLGQYHSDLWKYDPGSDSWTQAASAEYEMYAVACMMLQEKVYAGVGHITKPGSVYSDGDEYKFLMYDPVTNLWTDKANFPGPVSPIHYYGFSFSIGDTGYVGLGNNFGILYPEFWQYDPVNDQWKQKNNLPAEFLEGDGTAVGFTLDDKSAFVVYPHGHSEGRVWQYNAIQDAWIQKNPFPGSIYFGPKSMIIDSKAYVMEQENWQYDPVADSWTQKAMFQNRTGGACFALGSTGYYYGGLGYPNYSNDDLWQFTPE